MHFSPLRDVRVYSDVDSWVLGRSLWIKRVLLFERSGYDYESSCLISKHLPVDLRMRNVGANYFVGATAVWFMCRICLIRSWANALVPFSLSYPFHSRSRLLSLKSMCGGFQFTLKQKDAIGKTLKEQNR